MCATACGRPIGELYMTRPGLAIYNSDMTIRNVSDAKEQLSALLVMVEQGDEVVIARAGRPIARLVPFERTNEPRKLGALRGQIWISPDFDKPDAELEKLFYEGPIEPVD